MAGAVVAKGQADEADLRPALAANEAVVWRGGLVLANLTDLGIEQGEAGVEEGFEFGGGQRHGVYW